jgi:uncharacterized protein YyaL (SSP411 family)
VPLSTPPDRSAPDSSAAPGEGAAPDPPAPERPENRLAAETSPYLRQHRFDPVDWYPWGPEALQRARDLDRPLFLSIGYSACHWCHVMAHESFADETIAAEMNRLVVAVKIDREERPDIDSIYMEAVQAATGHGGWPMSVFATPDGKPFYVGTYFPNRPGRGAPTFGSVLRAIADAWETKREAVGEQAEALNGAVARRLGPLPSSGPVGEQTLDATGVTAAIRQACERLVSMSDPEWGGFGQAPKFPQPLLLDLLLRAHAEGIGSELEPAPIAVAEKALEAMAVGGIWDHLGGGFSRYSVDREWLVPHFEKMLYDQAQLAAVYLHAWQLTGDARWRQVLDEIISYVLSDLRLPGGGLASAEDADSEGEEGRFYLWDLSQIEAVLGPVLAPVAVAWWGVTDAGNFEGRNILRRPLPAELARPPDVEEARQRLLAARSARPRPGLDDKVLTEWNAMMCATLAEAALATGNAAWRQAAEELGDLLIGGSRRPSDGRVLRCPTRPAHAGGRPELLGYSVDVAWLAEACVRLAAATGHLRWLRTAGELADQLLELFEDTESGGLFTTGSDAEELVVRPRELYDSVTPSAGSVAAGTLARLGSMLGRDDLAVAATRLVRAGTPAIMAAPTAVPGLVGAADLLAGGIVEVVVTGERPDLVALAGRQYLPRSVLVWEAADAAAAGGGHAPALSPLLEEREPGFAFVCRHSACRLPSASAAEMEGELASAYRR